MKPLGFPFSYLVPINERDKLTYIMSIIFFFLARIWPIDQLWSEATVCFVILNIPPNVLAIAFCSSLISVLDSSKLLFGYNCCEEIMRGTCLQSYFNVLCIQDFSVSPHCLFSLRLLLLLLILILLLIIN